MLGSVECSVHITRGPCTAMSFKTRLAQMLQFSKLDQHAVLGTAAAARPSKRCREGLNVPKILPWTLGAGAAALPFRETR